MESPSRSNARVTDRTAVDGRVAYTRPSILSAGNPAVAFEAASVDLGGRTIWSGATLRIAQGEFIGLIGANGAGKTTLLRVLLGQVPLTSGRVEIFGEPPRRGNRAVGYVPQRRTLELDLAVRGVDFVTLGLTGHRWGFGGPSPAEQLRVQEALESVDALAFAEEPVGVLSGGEQQRLLIAQALLTGPKVLLLDEPLASLDLRSQTEIVSLLHRICRERDVTVVLVAHDINLLLPVLDRVVCVLDGTPVAASVDDLLNPALLSRLYRAPVRVVVAADGERLIVGV